MRNDIEVQLNVGSDDKASHEIRERSRSFEQSMEALVVEESREREQMRVNRMLGGMKL